MPQSRSFLFSVIVVVCATGPVKGWPPRTDRSGDPLPVLARARLGTLRFRHVGLEGRQASVGAFAYSRDGKVLVSLGWDCSICTWDATSGRRLNQFGWPSQGIAAFTVSADARRVAVCSDVDGSVWDATSGKMLELRRPWKNKQIRRFAFSPDGKTIALERGEIHLRDAATDRDILTFERKDRDCITMLFSPDGKTLIGGGPRKGQGSISFWDVASGKELRRIEAPTDRLLSHLLALSQDGRVLATGGNPVRLWDTATCKELLAVEAKGYQLAFSADGRTLASWDRWYIDLNETATGKRRLRLPGRSPTHTVFAFAPDNRTAAMNGGTSGIHIIDLITGKEVRGTEGHSGAVLKLCLSADGKVLATAGADHTARVWDVAGGRELRRVKTSESGLVALSPDGRRLAAVDGCVRIWDVTTGRELRRLGKDRNEYKGLAFAPDGKRLAASGWGETWLWDVSSGKELRRFEDGGSNGLCFSAGGDILATGSVRLWKVATGKLLLDLKHGGRPFNLSRDGKSLVLSAGQFAGKSALYEVSSGKQRRSFDTSLTETVSLAPDGRLLAVTDANAIVLWDLADQEQLLRLEGHRGVVTSLVFTADGKTLLSGSADSTVLIWDLSSVRVPPLPPVPVPLSALPVAKALSRLADAPTPALLEALRHPDPDVRTRAIESLAASGGKDKAVVTALTRALDEKDDEVREAAVAAVFALDKVPTRAIPALVRIVLHGKEREKANAAAALDNLGPEGKAALRMALKKRPAAARAVPTPRRGQGPRRRDRYGDPLPPGALARLGAARLRHPGVAGLAFSPDGTMLATLADQSLILWQLPGGKRLAWLPVQSSRFGDSARVLFTHDNQALLFRADGGSLCVWDIASRKEVRRIQGTAGLSLVDFALSSDGKLLAVYCGNVQVLVLEFATGKLLRRLDQTLGWNVRFARDTRRLLIGAEVWDVGTGKRLGAVSAEDEPRMSADISPDGKILATSHGDSHGRDAGKVEFAPSVRLWEAGTGKPLRRFRGDQQCIDVARFSPDGKLLAVAGGEPSIRLWDAATGKEMARLRGRSRLGRPTWSADGKYLAAVDSRGCVLVWDIKRGQAVFPPKRTLFFVSSVAYSPDSETLAVGGDGPILLCDPATGKQKGQLIGHRGTVQSLAWSPDGRWLASAGNFADGTTRLWDVAGRKERRCFKDRGGRVAWSLDGEYLASGRGPLRLRRAASGKELARFDYRDVESLCFSPDGTRLAASCSPPSRLYVVPSGREDCQFGPIGLQAFSPDGTLLASAEPTSGVTFLLVEPGTGKRSRYSWEGSGGATSVAWSPDGKTLALGREDGATSLWDAATARERYRLPAEHGAVVAVVFAPDGRTLTSVYNDGTALVWDVGRTARQ